MSPTKGKRVLLWIAVVAMPALITLAGCARVEIVDSMPVASALDPFSNYTIRGDGAHNLGVVAVDFDPPLNYQQLIIQRRSVALLVAVENAGSQPAHNVTVRVQLTTPDEEGLFQTQGASIASIAPGEVRVVRFSHLGEIPHHESYHLEVLVEPVDGESSFADNLKAFDIQVHQGQDSP